MGIEKLDVIEEFSVSAGQLNVLHFRNLPFTPVRIYWRSGLNPSASRGGHAHKELSQVFVSLSGSADISFWDGSETFEFKLKMGSFAVHVEPGFWRELNNFSDDAVVLVLANHEYNEADYIRSKDEFTRWKNIL